jgi:hypothetical protein
VWAHVAAPGRIAAPPPSEKGEANYNSHQNTYRFSSEPMHCPNTRDCTCQPQKSGRMSALKPSCQDQTKWHANKASRQAQRQRRQSRAQCPHSSDNVESPRKGGELNPCRRDKRLGLSSTRGVVVKVLVAAASRRPARKRKVGASENAVVLDNHGRPPGGWGIEPRRQPLLNNLAQSKSSSFCPGATPQLTRHSKGMHEFS